MKTIKIQKKSIGLREKTFVIAEIGLNHNGNLLTCKKLIKYAKNAGADAVKLQISDAEESYFVGTSSYKTFSKFSLTEKQIRKISLFAKKNKIILFATAGDIKSLEIIKKYKFPLIKISSGLLTNDPLILKASKLNLPIIISCGLAFKNEIKRAVKLAKSNRSKDIVLLKCTSLYPAPDDTINLSSISSIQKEFNCLVGYSDHTKDNLACLAAVSMGAKVIEKHFTLNKKQKGLDHSISANPKELKMLIKNIRDIEKMLGNEIIDKKKIIKNKLKTVTRSIFYSKDINKGNKITIDNIKSVRPGTGLHLYYFLKILGKKVKINCKAGQPAKLKDLIL